MVLGVALGLVFGIARVLGGVSADEPDQASPVRAAPTVTPSPSQPQPTQDAVPSPAGTDEQSRKGKKKKRKADREPEPLAMPTGPCRAEEIVATPQVVGDAYAGSTVRFRVELTTLETPACTWTASPTSMVVKLTSGEDRIWSSQDCPAAVPSEQVVVRAKVPATVDVGWRGQRSDASCSRTTAWAQPGWYHVESAAFGAEPTDLQFELKEPVPATITAEPKQNKRDKRD